MVHVVRRAAPPASRLQDPGDGGVIGRREPTGLKMGVNLLDARTFRRGKIGSAKFGVILFLLLVALLVTPSSFIMAQGPDQQAVVNGNFTLHSNQTINSNYTIAARQVEIEAGSKVTGDLSIVS